MTESSDTSELKRPEWPRPGASMAVFRDQSVLLVQRAKPPRTGLWAMPGGHVEPGEKTADTALRELLEETGVVADIVGLVTVHDALIRNGEGRLIAHYVLAVYAGRWRSGEPVAMSDAADAGFFSPTDLSRIALMPHTLAIIESARLLVRDD